MAREIIYIRIDKEGVCIFETTMILEKLPMDELRYALMPRRQRISLGIAALIAMCFVIIGTIFRDSVLILALVSLPIAITLFNNSISISYMHRTHLGRILERKRGERHASSAHYRKTLEIYSSWKYPFDASFGEREFEIRDDELGAVASVLYDDIIWCIETKSLYVLLTKAETFFNPQPSLSLFVRGNLCGVADKTTIDEDGKRDEFINFLKGKCRNMKWETV